MISGIKPTELLFRDGTSQPERLNAALNPDIIPVDERSTEDLLRFAQAFAKQLRFFDGNNQAQGNWEAFLVDDFEGYSLSSDEQREQRRSQWIADLMAYVRNPESYANDPQTLNRFSKPHLQLFVTFLQLIGILQEQLNGFTKRHLDFYYHEVLGLTEKQPIPDMVHVMIGLADGVNEFLLKEGTLLSAGKDGLGKELVYRTEEDVVINRAAIASIQNVFADKQITGIRAEREANQTEPDAGFLNMMQLALGDPEPGDALPSYNKKPADLTAVQQDLTAGVAKAQTYVTESLFLSNEDFYFLLTLDRKSKEEQWDSAYEILDAAYKAKVTWNRQQVLRSKREADPLNGLMVIMQYALGDPNANDPLPDYHNDPVGLPELSLLYDQLSATDDQDYLDARTYVSETLFLRENDFKKCIEVSNDTTTKADWTSVYRILEKAQSQKRNFQPGSPVREEYLNIYAIRDAKAAAFSLAGEEGKQDGRFNTFGKGASAFEERTALPAHIGLAFTSPQLLLEEGKRTIKLRLSFADTPETTLITLLNKEVTLPVTDKDKAPFLQFYLSGAETWSNVLPTSMLFSAVAPSDPNLPQVLCLDVQLDLTENDPAVTATALANAYQHIAGDTPALAILINNDELAADDTIPYNLFRTLQVTKIHVNVQVDQLHALVLQNDDTIIDYKKPFEPFGLRPATNDSFYFAHPEICLKKLDELTVRFEWMKPPSDLGAWYANYKKIADVAPAIPFPAVTNASFGAMLTMRESNKYASLGKVNLFEATDAKKVQAATITFDALAITNPGLHYDRLPLADQPRDLFDWKRYFRLELGDPDLEHDMYPMLMTRQAYLDTSTPANLDLKKLFLNPPYTPKLKTFTVGYKASFEINLEDPKPVANDRLFHMHPFGYEQLETAGAPGVPAIAMLLPDYTDEGQLYIGISGLETTQRLAILFQLAEGSGDPDLVRPEVKWSYLSTDNWCDFPAGSFISDTTNGLINTGIITLTLPADATNSSHLLANGLHWIRATVTENSAAITDTVNILTQAVPAIFVDQQNDPTHLLTLLPPGSIKELTERMQEIKQIDQPFASSKGKPAETGMLFYNHVSERLRHKNRAVTMWDYEHIILDRFPEIHKVKCVPADFTDSGESYGNVDVIVIPDIKGKSPFNPYQPKVPSDTLLRIQQYVEQRTPAYAEVNIRNASFLQVKTRFAVKFKESGNEQFFVKQLEDELKRYLAPWAFDDGAEIVLGGSIYASMLVNFIAGRSYVDYVAGMKLFQSMDGITFVDSRFLNNGENMVRAMKPDIVLVSAQKHEIDVVSENGFVEKDFSGIDYMKVELDFTVL